MNAAAGKGTAGAGDPHDSGPGTGTRHFGTGREARIAAMHAADELRGHGIAAAALFKPSMGGWIVKIYPGGIRPKP